MAIVSMANAVPGGIALAAEYNKVVANIVDINNRLGQPDGGVAGTRLTNLETRATSLESLTTNTSGTVGIGNQRLSDRLGPGVTNTTNVTTGTATAQLTDIRSRLSTLESGGTVFGPWVECPKLNGWANRTLGGSYPILSARTTPGNQIQIMGTLYKSAGAAPGEIVAQLPSGFSAPAGDVIITGSDNSGKPLLFAVKSTGQIAMYIPTGSTTTSTLNINDSVFVGAFPTT